MREGDRASWTITVTPDDVIRFLDFRQAATPRRSRRPSYFVEEEVAQRQGLPGPIVPGTLSMGLLSRLVLSWLAPASMRSFEVNFRRPVRQGEHVRAVAIVTNVVGYPEGEQVSLDIYVENADGDRPILGSAIVETLQPDVGAPLVGQVSLDRPTPPRRP
jgi:hypothetical protein